ISTEPNFCAAERNTNKKKDKEQVKVLIAMTGNITNCHLKNQLHLSGPERRYNCSLPYPEKSLSLQPHESE
ncbi:MAG: hypothetical protein ACPGWM_08240, partial [Flavobacteriales bacterium]